MKKNILSQTSARNFRDQFKFCSNIVCLPKNYNKMDIPPRNNDSNPLVIKMTMRLLDIFDISHEDFSISISISMSITWLDSRVQLIGNKHFVNLDIDFADHIWVEFKDVVY